MNGVFMMSNKYYTVEEEYKERFYKIPKVFFTNPKYMKLSNDSKLAYAILQDRLQLSIKNKWFDEKTGNIYFLYTNAKLAEILNCGKNRPTEIKKELASVHLLEYRRSGRGFADVLFLLKPEVTPEDIYKIDKTENDFEYNDGNESRKSGIKNPENRESRIPENGTQESRKSGTNDTDFSDTDFSDTDNNLNNMYTDNSNYPSSNAGDINFNNEEHKKDMILNKYPKEIALIVKQLPYTDCKDVMDIIFKAKSSITKELGKEYNKYGCDFSLEEHSIEISETVQRVINEAKSNNSSMKNYHAYLTVSIKNYYDKYADRMLQEQIERDMANPKIGNLFK